MSNASIRAAFAGTKAFIPFVTCGDPDLATTKAIVRGMAQAGADIIELGIPFSDPTAEGPVIQEANVRSLAGGTDTDKIFEMVSELRSGSDGGEPVSVPLVFMTYANVVFHYGTERFCERAAEVGMDGLILPDTPFEEKEEFARACQAADLAFISLIAPTSDDRIQMIAREAEGFIYLVSSMGVTGTRSEFTTDLDSIVERIREVSDAPIAIGFGISNAQQAVAMAQKADGAIVGSAIVKLVAEHGTQAAAPVSAFVSDLATAVHA
ncbi:tryptophan synthase subunit alpha [Anaerotardibacter muris]|uniref:tryptophan synthase subunit alpha n=1 Tax=Anaerotardibacter muris TaxID=2941505 RepID=UPI00203D3FB9|nr:tryptophan synthase subunit alpha [Anaerotardibacter muris]